MVNVILIAVCVLGLIGLASAVILFVVSHKFAVHEDPRIAKVGAVLPQANCGGCGYPGCSGFAAACVKAADEGSLEGKLCPVGGQPRHGHRLSVAHSLEACRKKDLDSWDR